MVMKTYSLEVTQNGEGISISTENYGFTPLEVYGMLIWKANDIAGQMRGDFKPDKVKRAFVIDEVQEVQNEKV